MPGKRTLALRREALGELGYDDLRAVAGGNTEGPTCYTCLTLCDLCKLSETICFDQSGEPCGATRTLLPPCR